jgi:hypothetical protein
MQLDWRAGVRVRSIQLKNYGEKPTYSVSPGCSLKNFTISAGASELN